MVLLLLHFLPLRFVHLAFPLGEQEGITETVSGLSGSPVHPLPPLHPRQGAEVSNCWEDDGGLAVHLGPAGKLKSFTVARGPDQRSAPVGGAGGLLVLGRG